MSDPPRRKRTILFLAANPKNSTPLRLDEELREIETGLRRAEQRDSFQLQQRWAVRPRDVQRAMLELTPQIVHFSGHGVGEEGLVLEDEAGKVKLVDAGALAGLFELFADQVECVLLNACYSEVQAMAIARHIPYVIGMKQEIGDQAAREFAVGFYDALGAGRNIEFAYKLGCTSIRMAGIAEELTPVLHQRSPDGEPPLWLSASPVGGAELPHEVEGLAGQLAELRSPVAVIDLEEPEGLVGLSSPLYVDRPPIEADCYAAILRPGALIRIKAPRQMGKSSLMQRILHHARQQGYETAALNFQLIEAEFRSSIDQFLQWFCANVTNEMNLEDRLAEYWKGVLGSKSKCTRYFQRYLLEAIASPLVLGLDEVDQVFPLPAIAQEFFGLLRAWHESGRNDPRWQKLRLVIVHSKEVYVPLHINQSPFNVGLPIELPELTPEQVMDLVQRHGLNWSSREVGQLMSMVCGHPYLVRKALYCITRGTLTLAQFLKEAPTEAGLYSDHLRRHLLNLSEDKLLAAAMKQVVASNAPVRLESNQAFQLWSMGLVELQGNEVVPACNLYRLYFRDRLSTS
jgi:hypothetical protein